MNRGGLKAASRQCLNDTHCDPRRLTLLFLLCLYAVTIPCDMISFFLEQSVNQVSGLGAMATRNRYSLVTMLLLVGINVIWILWNAGYTAFTLQLSRGGRAGFDDFFAGFRQVGRVLALTVMIFVYIWLWSMLFVIPGIVAAYSYRMAMYVLLDNPGVTASEAIAISKRLTYGHRMEMFVLDLSFIWYHLLGAGANVILTLFSYGLLPLQGWTGYLIAYGISILITCTLETLFRAYVQTTYAHAYNWLLSLDRARCEGMGYPNA